MARQAGRGRRGGGSRLLQAAAATALTVATVTALVSEQSVLSLVVCSLFSMFIYYFNFYYNNSTGTSLVAQWLRSRLPMQGTRVQALVREDPTCRGAPKPIRHNYR